MALSEHDLAKLNAEHLHKLIDSVQDYSERIGIYAMQLYNANGKWKYTAYIQMTKPKHFTWFWQPVNEAMASTPADIRGVTFTNIPPGWYGVMTESPWGFPILITTTD